MAAEPTWIAPVAASATILISIATIAWSKARAGGQDSTKLNTACDDIVAQQKVTSDHDKTLAAHTVLHEQHADDIERLQERILTVEQSASRLLGRFDADHNAGGRNRG